MCILENFAVAGRTFKKPRFTLSVATELVVRILKVMMDKLLEFSSLLDFCLLGSTQGKYPGSSSNSNTGTELPRLHSWRS